MSEGLLAVASRLVQYELIAVDELYHINVDSVKFSGGKYTIHGHDGDRQKFRLVVDAKGKGTLYTREEGEDLVRSFNKMRIVGESPRLARGGRTTMKRLAAILAEEGLLSSRTSSVEDYFDVWKATDGMWYGLVMEDKNYDPDDEDASWGSSAETEFRIVGRAGPESSEDDIIRELRKRHSNRALQVDRSGRRAPGKPSNRDRWHFADKEAGIVSPAARDVLETLSQLGPTELVSSVGDSLEFSVMVSPGKRVIITGVVDFDVFKYKVTYSTTARGVIEVTSDHRTQRSEAQDVLRLIQN